jgi:hypothetical protein
MTKQACQSLRQQHHRILRRGILGSIREDLESECKYHIPIYLGKNLPTRICTYTMLPLQSVVNKILD